MKKKVKTIRISANEIRCKFFHIITEQIDIFMDIAGEEYAFDLAIDIASQVMGFALDEDKIDDFLTNLLKPRIIKVMEIHKEKQKDEE